MSFTSESNETAVLANLGNVTASADFTLSENGFALTNVTFRVMVDYKVPAKDGDGYAVNVAGFVDAVYPCPADGIMLSGVVVADVALDWITVTGQDGGARQNSALLTYNCKTGVLTANVTIGNLTANVDGYELHLFAVKADLALYTPITEPSLPTSTANATANATVNATVDATANATANATADAITNATANAITNATANATADGNSTAGARRLSAAAALGGEMGFIESAADWFDRYYVIGSVGGSVSFEAGGGG